MNRLLFAPFLAAAFISPGVSAYAAVGNSALECFLPEQRGLPALLLYVGFHEVNRVPNRPAFLTRTYDDKKLKVRTITLINRHTGSIKLQHFLLSAVQNIVVDPVNPEPAPNATHFGHCKKYIFSEFLF